jgi:hypothetical protein
MTSNVIAIRPNKKNREHSEIQAANRHEVRKLAAALVLALNVAPGKALVMSLGEGHEATNFEAVESWVAEALVREQLPPGQVALGTLLPALEARLHTISEAAPQL